MGDVYGAVETKLERDVATKILRVPLPPTLTASPRPDRGLQAPEFS
jgi:hypothetical protein